MEFATQPFNADGRAALALVVGLIQVLKEKGVLTGEQAGAALNRGAELLPRSSIKVDVEALSLIAAASAEMLR